MDIRLHPRPAAYFGIAAVTTVLILQPKMCAEDVEGCMQFVEDTATNEGFVTISTSTNGGPGNSVQF